MAYIAIICRINNYSCDNIAAELNARNNLTGAILLDSELIGNYRLYVLTNYNIIIGNNNNAVDIVPLYIWDKSAKLTESNVLSDEMMIANINRIINCNTIENHNQLLHLLSFYLLLTTPRGGDMIYYSIDDKYKLCNYYSSCKVIANSKINKNTYYYSPIIEDTVEGYKIKVITISKCGGAYERQLIISRNGKIKEFNTKHISNEPYNMYGSCLHDVW